MNHHPFFALERPIAMAHRGGAGLWPENTMLAFTQSVELGYRFVETDLRMTADGVVVCLHDATLDRTTDGTGPVAAMSWGEVATVDAGLGFIREGEHPYRGMGVGVPRLDEVLKELPDTYFTLELKQDGLEETLIDLLERAGAKDRVLVGSFRDLRLAALRLLDPSIPISAGERETLRFWVASRTLLSLRTRSDALQVPPYNRGMRVVDRRLVRAAHRAGKQVHVWTIDDPVEMNRLLDLGVDGLITDRPDILRRVLTERP